MNVRVTGLIVTDEDTPEVSTYSPVKQEQIDDDNENTYCQESIARIEGEEKPLARERHS